MSEANSLEPRHARVPNSQVRAAVRVRFFACYHIMATPNDSSDDEQFTSNGPVTALNALHDLDA